MCVKSPLLCIQPEQGVAQSLMPCTNFTADMAKIEAAIRATKRPLMRSLATTTLTVAAALCLGACASREVLTEESAGCAKLSELKIGMTMSQALLSCERKPVHVTDAIIRGGIKETVWTYAGVYLHFVDEKITTIQNLR